MDADANPPAVPDNSYHSRNNRLQWYEVKDASVSPPVLESRTWYFYHYGDDGQSSGNPERIVTKPEASTQYTSVFFKYAKNNMAVTHVVGEQWGIRGLRARSPCTCAGDSGTSQEPRWWRVYFSYSLGSLVSYSAGRSSCTSESIGTLASTAFRFEW